MVDTSVLTYEEAYAAFNSPVKEPEHGLSTWHEAVENTYQSIKYAVQDEEERRNGND